MSLRMRVLPRFPARISGISGISTYRDGPDLVIKSDYGSLVRIPAVDNEATAFFKVWNADNDSYSIMTFQDVITAIGDITGVMAIAVYDPQGIGEDAFERQNHTGEQAISTITGLQDALDTKAPESTYAAKATGYTAVAADAGGTIRFTAAATLALTAAATLGSGWPLAVVADGGAVTIDPNGSETINGLATLVIPNGSTAEIICDGSNFFTIIKPTAWATIGAPITLSGQTVIDWTDLGAYRHLRMTLECILSANAQALMRVSTNNGSSFLAGSSDYACSWLAQAGVNVAGAAIANASSMVLTTVAVDASTQANITIDITNFNKALACTYKSDATYVTSGILRREFDYGNTAGVAGRNALRLLPATGNFSGGQVTLEGIRG